MMRTTTTTRRTKICVFGSGSFGTAMASLVARNDKNDFGGADVVILTRREDVENGINLAHKNPTHCSEFVLSPNIRATTSAREALENASVIVHAIPLQSTESFLEEVIDYIPKDGEIVFISTSKGIETETLELPCHVLERVLYRQKKKSRRRKNVKLAYLSGPTFAKQLINETPSGAVMAARTMSLSKKACRYFASPSFRCYPSKDVVGVCVGGALKNVVAILAGGLEGMGYGVNAVALLVTRGCREMTRIGIAMGASATTLGGLAGVGDLMLTCLGADSRNKAVGFAVASEEKSVAEVLESRAASLAGVAEGVATAPAAAKLCEQLKVDAPIFKACDQILKGTITPKEALDGCMTLPLRPDAPLRRKGFIKRTIFAHVVTAGAAVFVSSFIRRRRKKEGPPPRVDE